MATMREHNHFRRPDPDSQEIWLVTSSSSDGDWIAFAAETLVSERKAESVEVRGPHTRYRVESGQVIKTDEWHLVARCPSETMLASMDRLRELHPTELIRVEAQPIQYVDPRYRTEIESACRISETPNGLPSYI